MKTLTACVLLLTVTVLMGCQSGSPRGGSVLKDQGFTVVAPTYFATTIKQGETQSVPISLKRGAQFKQDVKLQIDASADISVEPTSVTIKASDSPDLQIRIAAAPNAALGDYRVVIRASPETGEPTSAIITVRVVSP